MWFMMKKKVLFSPLKGKQHWVSWFQGRKFPKIILLMTLSYSRNTERHRIFGFKAPDDNSRLLWRWTRDEARGGAVLHVIYCGDVPSVSRMILVAVEEPMKISLPGLLKIHLFPSLSMTVLYIIRQFRNRRTVKTHLLKKNDGPVTQILSYLPLPLILAQDARTSLSQSSFSSQGQFKGCCDGFLGFPWPWASFGQASNLLFIFLL